MKIRCNCLILCINKKIQVRICNGRSAGGEIRCEYRLCAIGPENEIT